MTLSPELRAEMLANTREAAFALIEDMQHIRDVLGREDTSSAEIRRLSVVLDSRHDETTFRYSPNGIDPVLIEVLSAAHFLTISPMIEELEKIIIEEMK